MKRSVKALSALLLASGVTAAAMSMSTLASAADSGGLVIGFATAETGFITAFDKPAVIGAKMAIEDFNKKGGVLGKKITWVNADTKSDIAKGAQAGQQVLAKGANAVLVTPDFNFGGGAAREAGKKNVIAISMGAGSPKFGVQGIGPFAYTMGVAASTDAAVAAEWAYQARKFRTAYTLNDNTTDYDTDQCRGFTTRWKELGGKLLGADTFKNSDPSVATQVTRIKNLSSQPDIIMLCSYPPGGGVAIKQLRDAGIASPIISNGSMDGKYWFKDSIPRLSDFYFTASASVYGNDPSAAVNSFSRRYRAKTGDWPPSTFPVFGYMAVQALVKAITRAGTTDGTAVAAVMDKFKQEPLLGLPVTFSATLHIDAQRRQRIIQVQQGKHSVAGTWSARKQPPLFGN
jgi:branched-chain amino acid transport system substrate-binding protein